MDSMTSEPGASKAMLWGGRVLTVLLSLYLFFDSGIKIARSPQAVEGTAQMGYPDGALVPIGAVLLISLVIYLIPRTSILGAILLTGYLGGATATMVRVSSPWVFFPVLIGALVWTALYLRDGRLRAMIPLRR